MNHSQRTLKQLLDQRDQVNATLDRQLRQHFSHDMLPAVRRCTIPGRKVRSLFFMTLVESARARVDTEICERVVCALELSHAASVLVDDVVDSDLRRHGTPAAAAAWGDSRSIVFSHLLTAGALRYVAEHHAIHRLFLDAYQAMARGELYDLLIPEGDWIFEGFGPPVTDKTTALFQVAAKSAGLLTGAGGGNGTNELSRLGEALGLLYQQCNDYHDWQMHNMELRHDRSQSWRVTFSLPLAVFLQTRSEDTNEVLHSLKTCELSFAEWDHFLALVWSDKVRATCEQLIDVTHGEVLRRTTSANLSPVAARWIVDLANLVRTETFWYHSYDMFHAIT